MGKISERSLSEDERKEYNRILMKERFGLEITKEEERLEKKGDAEVKRQYLINIIH